MFDDRRVNGGSSLLLMRFWSVPNILGEKSRPLPCWRLEAVVRIPQWSQLRRPEQNQNDKKMLVLLLGPKRKRRKGWSTCGGLATSRCVSGAWLLVLQDWNPSHICMWKLDVLQSHPKNYGCGGLRGTLFWDKPIFLKVNWRIFTTSGKYSLFAQG